MGTGALDLVEGGGTVVLDADEHEVVTPAKSWREEMNSFDRRQLQHACIFPLPEPRQCLTAVGYGYRPAARALASRIRRAFSQ